MFFCSYRIVRPERKCKITLQLSALVLGALLTPSFAVPGGPSATPSTPSIEPTKVLPETDSRKLSKYDVSRIGQRDIGKGFNLYSLRSEHELGQSIAAGLDRST